MQLGRGRSTVFSENETDIFFKHLFEIMEGGGVKNTFLYLNFSENVLLFNTFRNSNIPGHPSGEVGPSFLTSPWGVLHSPPPVVSALDKLT
jgi:hypothetical protein